MRCQRLTQGARAIGSELILAGAIFIDATIQRRISSWGPSFVVFLQECRLFAIRTRCGGIRAATELEHRPLVRHGLRAVPVVPGPVGINHSRLSETSAERGNYHEQSVIWIGLLEAAESRSSEPARAITHRDVARSVDNPGASGGDVG